MFGLAALLTLAPCSRGQIYAITDCVECFTPPLPPQCAVNYGSVYCAAPTIGVPYNQLGPGQIASVYPIPALSQGDQAYLVHYSYCSADSAETTILYGLPFGNFFSPGNQMYPGEPQHFYPGLHTAMVVNPSVPPTWFLNGSRSAPAYSVGWLDSDNNVVTTPTPTCRPAPYPSMSANSIYGDITVTGNSGTASMAVQLTVGGKVVVEGMIPIAH
jgi:hypothetical protein